MTELDKDQIVLLHLDDDLFQLESVEQAFASMRTRKVLVESFSIPGLFLQRLTQGPAPDVILLDVNLGATGSIGALLAGDAGRLCPDAVILMHSGLDDVDTISTCLQHGADDFLAKEADADNFAKRVLDAFKLVKVKRGIRGVDADRHAAPGRRMAGRTLAQIEMRVPLILNSAVSAVHISGESGTGKEAVANLFASHLGATVPFVKVNCGAISATLLESELFGYVKGAFTGASVDKRGLLESAHGGWIFLDEVAMLSASAQVALLSVLENREVRRVGSSSSMKIKLRVISATNDSLPDLVRCGRFRGDLWQRLCETEIHLPPLRERRPEIRELIKFFCERMDGGPYRVSAPALELLCSFDWCAGNVRELRNCLRAMTEFHVGHLLTPLAIPERYRERLGGASQVVASDSGLTFDNTGSQESLSLKWDSIEPPTYDSLSDLLLIEMVRRETRLGKVSVRGLAGRLGLSKSTLSARLRGLVARGRIGERELSASVGIRPVSN